VAQKMLTFNLNNELNEYNKSLTLRKRKIDFKTRMIGGFG